MAKKLTRAQQEKKAEQTAQGKKIMLEALENSLGVVTTACKATGLSRKTFYNWVQEDEDFADAYNAMKEIALDFVESSLHKLIREGNPASTIFFLKTQGRSRGYIERSEIDIKDRPTFVVQASQKGAMKVLKSIDDRDSKTG